MVKNNNNLFYCIYMQMSAFILCLIFTVYLSLTKCQLNICTFVFSLLCRFTDDTFNVDNAVTIGVDFKMRKITVDNK